MSSAVTTIEVQADRTDIASRELSYARLTVVGLLVMALGSLLGTVPEPFIGPIATAFSLIVAGVVWRFGRWTLLLAALYGVPPLVISSALLIFALIYPDSFLQFVPLVLVLGVGSLVSLVAGVKAFASYRRGDPAPLSTHTARWWLRATVVAVVALSVASAALAFTGRSTVDG